MVKDESIDWAMRLAEGPLSEGEQAALDAWLSEDGRHAGELLRMQATLTHIDRTLRLEDWPTAAASEPQDRSDAGEPANGVEADRGGSRRSRRFLLQAGGAGALAAGVAALWLVSAPAQSVETGLGELRRVPLSDGSVAALNTESSVAVTMTPELRTVRLEQGEAWFQVAPDKSRPFVVEAGDLRVRAVGTAFSLRRYANGTKVLVSEGVVELWQEGRPGSVRRLPAGSMSFVDIQKREIKAVSAPSEVDRELAWRSGEVSLEGQTLEHAVAEINRYNARKLVVEDAELARERLVGFFRANDPEGFARAVAEMVDARVVEDAGAIRLVRPRSATT